MRRIYRVEEGKVVDGVCALAIPKKSKVVAQWKICDSW